MSIPQTISISARSYKPDFSKERESGWWVEIFVAQPPCIYYFGPFENPHIAEQEQLVITQDLINQGCQGLIVRTHLYNPRNFQRVDYFPPGVDIN